MHRSSLTARRVLFVVLAIAGALAEPVEAAPAKGTVPASTRPAAYLGRWNYDQPDLEGTLNVALLRCPSESTGCVGPGPDGGPLEIPQIGDIVFSNGPDATVVGRTDVGCTWQFVARSQQSLELEPAGQFCFNQVNEVGYTITRWSVTVHGNHQHEIIEAISHRPAGESYEFVLENGRRTRAPEPGRPGAARNFTGPWEYTPPDPEAQINMMATREVDHEGQQRFTIAPQTGSVTLARGRNGTLVAQTADGCQWTLLVRGNTAALARETQTCTVPDTPVTLTHWTIASDGRHQISRMRGTRPTDTGTATFVLSIGDLQRSGR